MSNPSDDIRGYDLDGVPVAVSRFMVNGQTYYKATIELSDPLNVVCRTIGEIEQKLAMMSVVDGQLLLAVGGRTLRIDKHGELAASERGGPFKRVDAGHLAPLEPSGD